jgi:hypothetical protein
VTLTPGSPYDEDRADDARVTSTRSRRIPARVAMFAGLLLVIVVITSTGSTRSWWAHRVRDMTGGARTSDYFIGLAVGLLPVLGVALGRVRTRGPRRVFRMLFLGAAGFVVTYLLSPSPARYLTDHSSRRVFDQQAPGYLAGVLTGAVIWVAAFVLAILLARSWWHRFTSRHLRPGPDDGPSTHRVIDV